MSLDMDCNTDISQILKDLEWEDICSTLTAVVMDLLDETPIPTPPPPPSPPVIAVLESNDYPEAVESLSRGGCDPLEAAPHGFEQPQPFAVTSPHLCNSVPLVCLPEHVTRTLYPVGFLNGEVVYMSAADTFTDPVPAAPQLKICKLKKRKHDNQYSDWPYVKKPLNAFMIYMKEQRAKVVAETNIRWSATINKILGQRWNSLPAEKKAKYYEEAVKENLLHILHHPEWSARYNYGKYRRKERKTRTHVKMKTVKSASACTIESFPAQAGLMPSPQVQAEVTAPVCPIYQLPQIYNMYCPDVPATACADLL